MEALREIRAANAANAGMNRAQAAWDNMAEPEVSPRDRWEQETPLKGMAGQHEQEVIWILLAELADGPKIQATDSVEGAALQLYIRRMRDRAWTALGEDAI